MKMADFTIKRGDDRPLLNATLKDANDSAVDITNADSVTLKVRKVGASTLLIDAAATIVSAVDGTVRYELSTTQTAVAGHYIFEFQVNWGSATETFPTEGQSTLDIEDDADV